MLLNDAELDPFFEGAEREWFRLEALHSYRYPVETPRLRAYLAGEPYDPSAEPREWYDYIQRRVGQGVRFSKVRVLRGPLSEYERWECEWSYTPTERHGQRTFILDLAEVTVPPALPEYDWWMFDERVVLRMHYDEGGTFVGAEVIDDTAQVAAHRRHRDVALAAAVAFPDYWSGHPQYWRCNWLNAPA